MRSGDLADHPTLHVLEKKEQEELAAMRQARASHIPELQRFVRSIERDKAAVFAGLTLPYSNGVVEGKVRPARSPSEALRCSRRDQRDSGISGHTVGTNASRPPR